MVLPGTIEIVMKQPTDRHVIRYRRDEFVMRPPEEGKVKRFYFFGTFRVRASTVIYNRLGSNQDRRYSSVPVCLPPKCNGEATTLI